MGKPITGISDQALEILEKYQWPGNIRELEHVIERACVLCNTPTISSAHLPEDIIAPDYSAARPAAPGGPAAVAAGAGAVVPPVSGDNLADMPEDQRIIAALTRTGGNKAKAARLLGIDRSTLYRKIRDLNIDVDQLTI